MIEEKIFDVNSLNRNRYKKAKLRNIVFLSASAIYTFIGAQSVIFEGKFYGYLYLFTGIGLLINFALVRNHLDKLHIKINNEGVYAKLSLYKKFYIAWSNIKKISLKPLKIIFTTKEGESKELKIDSFSFTSVKELKAHIVACAKVKNIELT